MSEVNMADQLNGCMTGKMRADSSDSELNDQEERKGLVEQVDELEGLMMDDNDLVSRRRKKFK